MLGYIIEIIKLKKLKISDCWSFERGHDLLFGHVTSLNSKEIAKEKGKEEKNVQSNSTKLNYFTILYFRVCVFFKTVKLTNFNNK